MQGINEMKYELRESVRVSQLCEELGLALLGNDTSISAVASLDTVSANTLTFSKSSSNLASLEGIFCVNSAENLEPSVKHSFILCDNPRMTFIRALAWLEDTIGFDQYNEEADIPGSLYITADNPYPSFAVSPRMRPHEPYRHRKPPAR